MEKQGKLYGIGVGSGNPEYLTIKAVKTIQKSDIIAVPITSNAKNFESTALSIIEEYAKGKEIIECRFSMEKNAQKRKETRQAVADQIIEELNRGKNVGFVTLGDTTTYSTYMYVHEIIAGKGYKTEIIPGITSYSAAAAELGIALCEGNEPLMLIPAGCDENIDELLNYCGNKVIMKSGINLTNVLKKLKERGYGNRTKIAYRVSMDGQKLYSSIEEYEQSKETGYFTLVIVKEK